MTSGGNRASGCPASLAGRVLLEELRLVVEVLPLLLDAELEAGLEALESPFSSYESAPSSTYGLGGCSRAGSVSAMVRCGLLGLLNDSRQYSAGEAVDRSSAR